MEMGDGRRETKEIGKKWRGKASGEGSGKCAGGTSKSKEKVPVPSWTPTPTLENCNNRLEGDRLVVITIFGSYVPTFAYSSSTWFFGSTTTTNTQEIH